MLRVLIDRSDAPGQFLLLGSASPALLRQTSESLLGRVEVVEVGGFDLEEVGADELAALWLRGGFPRSFLAGSDADSLAWRLRRCNGTSSPTCRGSASTCRRRRCCASGACSVTCTVRPGTLPSRHARSASRSRPCAAIWTC